MTKLAIAMTIYIYNYIAIATYMIAIFYESHEPDFIRALSQQQQQQESASMEKNTHIPCS